MNWINAFELICYIIVLISLISLVHRKDYNSLFTFGTAALVGFAMELMAVSVTDIYYYSSDYWLVLGIKPYHFPVFGGLMWGGLTVYAIKLAKKLKFNRLLTSLSAGMLIVTMDLLLDVVAIRLDGGFWTWVGNPITLDINNKAFMSVIWVNFLGYMIEIPAVVWLTLRTRERVKERDFKRQTVSMLLNALGGIAITVVGSLISLLINSVTNSMFACIVFSALWIVMAFIIGKRLMQSKMNLLSPKKWDYPMVIFWTAIYLYCLAAIVSLGIHATYPWFFIMGIGFMVVKIYICIAEPKGVIYCNKI